MTDIDAPYRILCVCLGNICRSPTAEGVLSSLMGGRAQVDSAGTGAWHVGKPPYPPAIEAARKRGYHIGAQRARQVSAADFHRFDLILAMDRQNLADLSRLAPADPPAQLALFLSRGSGLPADVPDPYFTGDFDAALALIETGARAWTEALARGLIPRRAPGSFR